jgi:hypothetical protein
VIRILATYMISHQNVAKSNTTALKSPTLEKCAQYSASCKISQISGPRCYVLLAVALKCNSYKLCLSLHLLVFPIDFAPDSVFHIQKHLFTHLSTMRHIHINILTYIPHAEQLLAIKFFINNMKSIDVCMPA